jgi:hypothetical protein
MKIGSRPVYIIANALPAEFGWGTIAPSLRAQQLANQARRAGADVTYIIFQSRYKLINRERRSAFLVGARSDTIVTRVEDMAGLAARLPMGTMIFTQADFAETAEAVKFYHNVIYDILAPKVVEISVGGFSQSEIDEADRNHRLMLGIADRIFVNGEKTLEYFGGDLNAHPDCVINRFAPKPLGSGERRNQRHLIFGGRVQKWNEVDEFYAVMAKFFRRYPKVPAFFFSPEVSLNDPRSRHISALALMPNVRFVSTLPLRAYMELLTAGLGFIDVGAENEERKYSTSTRVLQAVGAELPVLHQPGTGLDSFWQVFPGERIAMANFDDEAVADFVLEAHKGRYNDACRLATEAQMARYNDAAPFKDFI